MGLEDYHRQLMQDPKVAAVQRLLRPRLDLGQQSLHLGLEHGGTQKELAERAGARHANISRPESGLLNPLDDLLQRVAEALGADLTVTLEPVEQSQPVAALLQETIDQEFDFFPRYAIISSSKTLERGQWTSL